MLMFVFEATQELIQNLGNNVKSISNLDPDSKEMLYQLFSLIDLSFNWEFTSTKRKWNITSNINLIWKILNCLFSKKRCPKKSDW